jgi:hypothetical protein
MVQQTEMHALVTAWRALASGETADGWRTIPVIAGNPCRLLAGRHFPGNHEALLVGFARVAGGAAGNLPEANGFLVSRVASPVESEDRIWFALMRQPAGSLDMFTMMAVDVIESLDHSSYESQDNLFRLFLGRIEAWQNFMQHSDDGVLSPDAEVGLHGELILLRLVLDAGMSSGEAVNVWVGPLGGIQDFRIGSGAIEVKTTISANSFPAKIFSLEQLDDDLVRPLFLAGIRLKTDKTGMNLQERVKEISDTLRSNMATLRAFENRVLQAGFSPAMAERYPRKFCEAGVRMFIVNGSFPRLTRAGIGKGILRANYEIDIDLVQTAELTLESALQTLGAL